MCATTDCRRIAPSDWQVTLFDPAIGKREQSKKEKKERKQSKYLRDFCDPSDQSR